MQNENEIRTAVYSKSDLARHLGISVRHLEKLVQHGIVPQPVRLGRCIRFVRAGIDEWLADGCPGAPRQPGASCGSPGAQKEASAPEAVASNPPPQ